MDEILVSVIIPAYNCSKFISLALDSALAQDVPMEIIVINDCSKDDLDQVMQKYLKYPQIRYLKNEENMGVAETRNKGVRLAQGEYVAFLDADDYWDKDKLKKQLKLIREKGTVLCSTARELMRPDGTLTGYIIPVKTEFSFRDLRLQNQVNCSSVLMRADVAKEFPMHHDDSHEDYLMWLEVLEKYGDGCAINEPLLKYRISDTGKSGNKWNSAKMTYRTYTFESIMSDWRSFDRSLTFHGITYRTDFYKAYGHQLLEHVFYEDHEYAIYPCAYAITSPSINGC